MACEPAGEPAGEPADQPAFEPPFKPDPIKWPAISCRKYEATNPRCWWEFGGISHLHEVIEHNDVAALREFIRLAPDLLTWQMAASLLEPPLVKAAMTGHEEVLRVLLEYYVSLPPEERTPPKNDIETRGPGSWGTPLTAACYRGRFGAVQLLLELMPGVDIEERDTWLYTPLLAAVKGSSDQHARIVRLLLDRGADAKATIPVWAPLTGGDEDEDEDDEYDEQAEQAEQAEQYDEQDDEDNDEDNEGDWWVYRPKIGQRTALTIAMGGGGAAVVEMLVEAGLDIHGEEAIVEFIFDPPFREAPGQDPTIHIASWSPLQIGSMYHNAKGLDALLRLGAGSGLTKADDRGRLPLHLVFATYRDSSWSWYWKPERIPRAVETVRVLASVDEVRAETINARDAAGNTPLHLALDFELLPLVRALLDCGADPSIPLPDGRTALQALYAITFSRRDAEATFDANCGKIEALVHDLLRTSPLPAAGNREATDLPGGGCYQNDAVRGRVDAAGNTPLHRAAQCLMPISVAALIRHGARADARNDAGDTPLHLVARNPTFCREAAVAPESHPMTALLVDAGGDMDAPNNAGETARGILERGYAQQLLEEKEATFRSWLFDLRLIGWPGVPPQWTTWYL